jgi:hypothetical protein
MPISASLFSALFGVGVDEGGVGVGRSGAWVRVAVGAFSGGTVSVAIGSGEGMGGCVAVGTGDGV